MLRAWVEKGKDSELLVIIHMTDAKTSGRKREAPSHKFLSQAAPDGSGALRDHPVLMEDCDAGGASTDLPRRCINS
ncbi:hypothetical protein MPLSOD_40619 [Mesorhizobium sp. SOD10]|jgi:hypothetical protein|nr:hypothetical protein MPLSOD_40619 [Mesorhizobium sp. SOD10]